MTHQCVDLVETIDEPCSIVHSTVMVTTREIEVLMLMSQGLTVKEIAESLYLSGHTIISHKKKLLEKFDAKNSIELIVKCIKMDIIDIY